MEKIVKGLIAHLLTMNPNLGLLMTTIRPIFVFSTKKEFVEVEPNADMLMAKKNWDKRENLTQTGL